MHLSEYMAANNLDDEVVATGVNRSRVTISRIRRRLVRPDWETINALTEYSDGQITANDFQHLDGAA